MLELGGKAPLIVLDDADLDGAVNAAAFGAFMNQGQICMSTERIIVDESVADAFVAKLAAQSLQAPRRRPARHVVLGFDDRSRGRPSAMDVYIKDAVDKAPCWPAAASAPAPWWKQRFSTKVTPKMRIYNEESFGPVKSVIRVKGVDEAVRVANDTDYGLSSAVFGKDIMRAMAVAKRIHAGICTSTARP